MSLKVGIVGCGKIADGHVEEIQKMPEVARVVGVCDREPIMAEQVAMRYGLGYHTHDVERLLAEQKPDVLHITTPPASHLPLAKLAVDAGCHVYVEKPMTLSLADTRELLQYADRAGKKVTVGYTYLFDPPAREMRALIDDGVLGDIVHVESFYGYNLAGAYGSAILGDPNHWVLGLPGQLAHNNIDHLLNKALEFMDADEPRVTAHGFVRRKTRFGDARDAMIDELRLMIDGGGTTVFGTFSSHIRPAGHFARVYGTKSSAHVDYLARTVTLESSGSLPSAIGRLVPAFEMAARFATAGARNVRRFARSEFHFFSGLRFLFSAFYESILAGGPLPISYRDILRVSAMLDDIFAQVKTATRPVSS
ncbi:MAG: Gfo/Idh/MocA family oxidoreductase [Labilithrix sp.]|nr:Gfo/Idh/MocA family oxidoreductase [Labilithrix sp.]